MEKKYLSKQSLLKIPNTSNQYYDISEFLIKSDLITTNNEHHFSMLLGVIKDCQRFVGLADMATIPFEASKKDELLYKLFELETIFDTVKVVMCP